MCAPPDQLVVLASGIGTVCNVNVTRISEFTPIPRASRMHYGLGTPLAALLAEALKALSLSSSPDISRCLSEPTIIVRSFYMFGEKNHNQEIL